MPHVEQSRPSSVSLSMSTVFLGHLHRLHLVCNPSLLVPHRLKSILGLTISHCLQRFSVTVIGSWFRARTSARIRSLFFAYSSRWYACMQGRHCEASPSFAHLLFLNSDSGLLTLQTEQRLRVRSLTFPSPVKRKDARRSTCLRWPGERREPDASPTDRY